MASQQQQLAKQQPAGQPPPGFNRTKRRWARGFLWTTAAFLIIDYPLLSTATSACAVYTMHGGAWLSQKNIKWMSASIISFVVSLYAMAMQAESYFVDEEKAYELKATMGIKHRVAELLWGGVLLLVLCLTIKEHIDGAVEMAGGVVERMSIGGGEKEKPKIKFV